MASFMCHFLVQIIQHIESNYVTQNLDEMNEDLPYLRI